MTDLEAEFFSVKMLKINPSKSPKQHNRQKPQNDIRKNNISRWTDRANPVENLIYGQNSDRNTMVDLKKSVMNVDGLEIRWPETNQQKVSKCHYKSYFQSVSK